MTIKELLKYIDQNLNENLKLVDMASMVGYSPRQLYNILKEYTGKPIMSYIREQRIYKAAEIIVPGRNMYDVAMDYGFDTQAGFYKAFMSMMGCSPSDYKAHKFRGITNLNIPSLNNVIMEENFMEDLIIRKVTLNDVKSIWENIYSRNTPAEVEVRIANSIMQMNDKKLIHFIAVIDGNAVGNMIFKREEHIFYSKRCTIFDAVVNPAFQRLGIASRLFEECCKYANEMGAQTVITTCRGNGTENFYKSLGMLECGRIPNGIIEPWGEECKFDEIILYKELF